MLDTWGPENNLNDCVALPVLKGTFYLTKKTSQCAESGPGLEGQDGVTPKPGGCPGVVDPQRRWLRVVSHGTLDT